MPSAFFKNYRVYFLTAVAYMGSLLFAPRPIKMMEHD
ncbi:Bchxt15 [Botrytis cinerea B05.10]|uniref:Bchxt15 n=1 Tax=Botryotinia fuckeliana (strain B05.10) TaxID=332648 RepID=A0A384JMJ2_BOTFB|nr:Bchxt15 [Botrytis cinerea B05.10]ATZ51809.1 Bchxt15 [Botrytis cinerea B05.10]